MHCIHDCFSHFWSGTHSSIRGFVFVDRGWMLLPTRPQRYYAPASLVYLFSKDSWSGSFSWAAYCSSLQHHKNGRGRNNKAISIPISVSLRFSNCFIIIITLFPFSFLVISHFLIISLWLPVFPFTGTWTISHSPFLWKDARNRQPYREYQDANECQEGEELAVNVKIQRMTAPIVKGIIIT